MILLTAIRWHTMTALRSPAVWLLWIGMAVLWPTLQALMALGLTTSARLPESALWQIAMLASLAGACCAMFGLCKHQWWAQRCTPLRRIALEVGSIATFAAVLLGAACLSGAWSISLPSLATGWLLGLVACLHLGLLGSLLLAFPRLGGPGSRTMLLPLLAWLLPGWWAGNGVWGRWLGANFEIARYFEFPFATVPPANFWATALLTLSGLLCLRLAACTIPPQILCATPSSETSTPT